MDSAADKAWNTFISEIAPYRTEGRQDEAALQRGRCLEIGFHRGFAEGRASRDEIVRSAKGVLYQLDQLDKGHISEMAEDHKAWAPVHALRQAIAQDSANG